MNGCVRRSKRSVKKARRATPMYVPREPSDAERRAHESITYCTDLGANTASEDDQKKVLTSVERSRATMVSQLCKMDYAFLHDTGDKVATVTFLTMVDNSSGQMVATAVQKKGHDKFVERFLLEGLESFGVSGEIVLQTDEKKGTDRYGKTRGS